ncbi:exodeoxyribonuclease V subunit alpha [Neisseriaceae bacterium B1]
MPIQENQAAQAVYQLFHSIEPTAADIVAPFLTRLFQAQEEGHSFIYVSADESAQLAQAQPFVATHNAPLILQQRRLFLAKYHQQEQQLAQEIERISAQKLPEPTPQMRTQLALWFSDSGSQDQQAAAALALISPFMLISGGPGTGKTTTVAKLLALLCQTDFRLPEIRLAAPTGKAAARMTEALKNAVQHIPDLDSKIYQHLNQLSAQTVHRLLGLTPPQMQPRHHAQNPIHADILLLDEASMLDNELLCQLLRAVPSHCRVILLGDANQLPAVGMGAILNAFNQAPPLKIQQNQLIATLLTQRIQPQNLAQQHARLTISHRFNAESGIGQLAYAVLAGEAEYAWAQFSAFPGQLHHETATIANIATQLYQQHSEYWQAIAQNNIQAAFTQLSQLIILTATRQDSEQLNQAYHKILQKNQIIGEAQHYAGQVIMISRNDHAQKLYNGDIGIIHQHENHLVASFLTGDNLRQVPANRLPEHENAFAMTVHKSQGSEYQSVWFIAPSQATNSNRALLYTAITRAKSQFTYFGNFASFQAACTQQDNRRSALADYLFRA